ncbi:MAG: hypothetical protein WBV82_07070 [Myxococcaceae bacterium]
MADGTSICPSCDHIIDASFLSANPPEADDELQADEPTQARRPEPGPRRSTPGSGRRPGVRRVSRSAGAASAAPEVTDIRHIDEVESAFALHEPFTSPERLFADMKAFISGLNTSDKLAFVGSALTVLWAFFPWKETRDEGEVVGLMSFGLPAIIASVLTMTTVGVRVGRSLPNLAPAMLWLVQLASVGFAIAWALVFIKASWDSEQVLSLTSDETMARSKPAFGVFLALLTEAVALGGTLMGSRERPT